MRNKYGLPVGGSKLGPRPSIVKIDQRMGSPCAPYYQVGVYTCGSYADAAFLAYVLKHVDRDTRIAALDAATTHAIECEHMEAQDA